MAENIKFNYDSDFQAVVRLLVERKEGSVEELGAPNVEWRMTFAAGNVESSSRKYECSLSVPKGDTVENESSLLSDPEEPSQELGEPSQEHAETEEKQYVNAYVNGDGRIVCVFDNHNLGKGSLYVKFEAWVPYSDEVFPDGYKKLSNMQATGIELVGFRAQDYCDPVIELKLPEAFLEISDTSVDVSGEISGDDTVEALVEAYNTAHGLIRIALAEAGVELPINCSFVTMANEIRQMQPKL